MKLEKKPMFIPLSILLVGLIVLGCRTSLKYSILNTLFDGVPKPDTVSMASADLDIGKPDSLLTVAKISAFEKNNVQHPPFRERMCSKCHEDFSKRFVKPMPQLCFQCHEPFWNKYDKLHGPVISGHCIKCHDPHFTDQPRMLKREGQNICLECHQGEAIFANTKHSEIGQRMCTDCHSPHGGHNNFMLKPGSCYNCHDIHMTEADGFKHGPVASDQCYQCHDTHQSKAEHKLLRTGQDICLKCHGKDDIMANEAHNDIGTTICTECHSPHQSDQKYMLIVRQPHEGD